MSAQHDRFGPPEAYGEPRRTGRFWFDLLAATAAIFISVVSLVVAFRGEETQRGLLAANAWPFLQLSKNYTVDQDELVVENAGVGPAKIYSFEVFYKNQPVNSASDLLKRCCGVDEAAKPPVFSFGYGSVYENVLRPGQNIVALILKTGRAPETIFNRFTEAMPDFTFRACYCSVLQECWISDLQSLAQKAVKSCPNVERQFVQGEGHTAEEPRK